MQSLNIEEMEQRALYELIRYRMKIAKGREYRHKRRVVKQGHRRRGWQFYNNR
jgi:hypothetical protein